MTPTVYMYVSEDTDGTYMYVSEGIDDTYMYVSEGTDDTYMYVSQRTDDTYMYVSEGTDDTYMCMFVSKSPVCMRHGTPTSSSSRSRCYKHRRELATCTFISVKVASPPTYTFARLRFHIIKTSG